MLVTILPLLLGAALASDAPVDDPTPSEPDRDWEAVYRRASRTSHAGMVTNWVGVGLMFSGAATLYLSSEDWEAVQVMTIGAGAGRHPPGRGGCPQGSEGGDPHGPSRTARPLRRHSGRSRS